MTDLEPLAAAIVSREAPIDVDRLARALILTGLYIDDSPAPPKELAADLAAEYAALDRLDRMTPVMIHDEHVIGCIICGVQLPGAQPDEALRQAAQRVIQEWRTSSLHEPDPPALREAVEALVAALDRHDR